MGEPEEHGTCGSKTGMQLQGGSSSSSSGGGGGGGWRVNKEVMLPVLMVLKESLKEEMRQVKSLISIIHGEDNSVEEEDSMAQQKDIQRKALADEQDRILELKVQLEIMKLSLSCGFSGASTSY